MKRKNVIKTIGTVAAVVGTGSVLAGRYLYNTVIKRDEKKRKQDKELEKKMVDSEVFKEEGGQRGAMYAQTLSWLGAKQREKLEIVSFDGLKLCASFYKAEQFTTKTVIVAHGYMGSGKNMATYIKMYIEEFGFNVLVPDARGHGKSDGDYVGFGWDERHDYLQWIDLIVAKLGKSCQIVLHGVSMGASTVMMTSGEELPEQVVAGVEDCGYTTAEEIIAYQLKSRYKMAAFPVVPIASYITKIKNGYNFKQASAIEQLKKTKLPMLFIHGEQDDFVPFDMQRALYESCNSEKDILVVRGAGHAEAYSTNPEEYTAKVHEFLSKYIKEE